ncbi:astacin-like metalloendopeptidase [Panonychus citri]|uniref:astacin-like metalloendopeptidase n=1 Tax=Panonychus citri TaxID=50023 RepID=UPI002307ECDC|nr:astacin-like metalloendopeptidase [Panonychus citri]
MFPNKLFQLFCLNTLLLLVINCSLISGDRYNPKNNNRRNNQNGDQSNRPSDNRNVKRGLDEDMKHPLGKDDFDRAKSLDERLFAVNDKVLYSGKLFEGDIVDDLLSGISPEKNAINNPNSHWPNGKVPYVISRDFNGEERSVIARAIDDYHSRTCIRFEPYTGSEPNYIHLVRGSGCSSRVGMTGGMQQVTLGQGCVTVGIVEHELMHALGFVHEQSRTDRDRYIRVNYQNIRRGLEQNFRKYSVEEITTLNEPYDYGSVLHYGSTAFTNGNGPTIEPLEGGTEIGQRVGFSQIDLAKINKLYRCGRQGFQNNNERPNSSDRNRPESGSFGGHRPDSSQRPNRERPEHGSRPDYRPDSSSLHKPDSRPGFGSSGYPNGFISTSTYRPSIVDGIFGGFQSTHRPTYRPDNHGHQPGIGGSGNHRPDYGHNQGHQRPSSRPDIGGFGGIGRPSTIDPESEYELGGGGSGSRYTTTRRPSGFGGYSTTYRPYRETETEYSHVRPSYTSTYRPYGSSRPDYENNFGNNNHRPGSSPYDREVTSTFRPFGGTNIGNFGHGISSIFSGRLPGSSIIDAIRPGGGNGPLGGLGGNRGSSIISSFLRPDRFIGLIGQDDPNNQSTTKSPKN